MSMQLDFRDKRVLVTGGTRGIGRAAVEGFHELGARVAVNGRTGKSVAQAIAEMGGGPGLVPAPGDLSALANCRGVVAGAIADLGGLDVLVNNAGRGDDCLIDDLGEVYWEMMLALNLRAPLFCIKPAVSALRESKGNVVNIASIYGVVGGPAGTMVYCTTKGGLVNMTRALAIELAKDGVRVNCLCPGWIDTKQPTSALAWRRKQFDFARDLAPLGRLGTIRECASAILYLASDQAGFTTGSILLNDGGVTAG
ncbi:MAG: SDR family oxidoreductase [Alphaproteobacteria bacterium]